MRHNLIKKTNQQKNIYNVNVYFLLLLLYNYISILVYINFCPEIIIGIFGIMKERNISIILKYT